MGEQTERLAQRYREAERSEPTYPEVGATEAEPPTWPDGYHRLERRVRVGHGEEAFHDARITIFTWGMPRRAGLTVYPADVPPKEGHTVLVVTRVGPLRVIAPCRVIWTVDEPTRAGFGYGTLPGHPERGEEAFLVERDQADDVWVAVRAFSRASTWYARLGSPVAKIVQRRITEQYLRAFDN